MIKTIFFTSAGALALAACGGSAPDAATTSDPAAIVGTSKAAPAPAVGEAAPSDVPASPTPAPAPLPIPDTMPPPPASLPSRDEKSEEGARAVVRTWARALENRQFGIAWDQFGSPPASRAAYAKWWERYRTIRVSLGRGEGDAAMGSLYYTVPATLTGTTVAGKPYRLQGDVVVRRVNDVDGATPAQLRWHIGTADLKDVGMR